MQMKSRKQRSQELLINCSACDFKAWALNRKEAGAWFKGGWWKPAPSAGSRQACSASSALPRQPAPPALELPAHPSG